MLTDHQIEALQPMHRHDAARKLLEGDIGPLAAMPSEPHVAALAYLIYLARRTARRPGNMLSNRPVWEADDTLRNRVLSTAECVVALREFGHELFERLNVSLGDLQPRDALWWMTARQAHAERWRELSEDRVLTEACTLARLLDEMLKAVEKAAEAAKAKEEA